MGMAEAPWYLSNGRPGLRHQRLNKDISKIAKVGNIVKRGYKYDEDGNLIRKRKFKAKYRATNIAPEEHIQSLEDDKIYTYDGKRDRWNNYNIANHQLIIERHEKIEKYRRDKKAAE